MVEVTDIPCRDAALAVHAPLFGTAAANTDLWVVLETSAAWGPKGLEDSDLPAVTVQRLKAFCAAHPRARVQLIRKPERSAAAPRLFLAYSGERGAYVERVALARHEDLVDVDLEIFARGQPVASSERLTNPLYLVCVHGKRDSCCARHGMPVYSALATLEPDLTFQTTHLGGHRFAATMVILPHGLSYGRVLETEAPAIVAAHGRGELYDLERLRGRTTYAPAVQAADYMLRKQLGALRVDGLSFERVEPIDAGERVFFRDAQGAFHSVDVGRAALQASPASCGERARPTEQFVTLKMPR